MPKDPADFRDTLEQINLLYPAGATLTIDEVRELTRWKDIRTIKKYLPMVKGERFNKVTVAKMLCGQNVMERSRA